MGVLYINTSSDEYYYSNNDYTCIDCENIFDHCLYCKPGGICIQCEEGYALIDKTECDYIAAYKINEQYFSDDYFINFYKCDNTVKSNKAISNCEKCEFSLETMENKCIQCKTNYIILDNNALLCISLTASIQEQIDNNKIIPNELGNKYYTCSKLMENCDICDDMNTCRTCKDNYVFLDDNKTICYLRDTFTNGHYYTTDGGINYYSCIDNCLLCEDSIHCITCDSGYELNDFSNKCNLILKTEEEIRDNCAYITSNIDDEIDDLNNYIFTLANNYWLNYREEKNYLVKYINQNENYTILIFKNYQCSLHLYEEESKFKIDTTEIIGELKKYITINEIIQVILLYKNHTGIKFFENYNGNYLDINSLCPSCLNKKYKITYNYGNKIILPFWEF